MFTKNVPSGKDKEVMLVIHFWQRKRSILPAAPPKPTSKMFFIISVYLFGYAASMYHSHARTGILDLPPIDH